MPEGRPAHPTLLLWTARTAAQERRKYCKEHLGEELPTGHDTGSLTEDVASRALGDWYGILLITAFNLSDLAGRVASNYLLVARKTVLGLAVGRIALVSLFFLRETRRRHPTPTDRVPTRSRCSGWRTGRGRGSRRCSRWRWGSGPPTGT